MPVSSSLPTPDGSPLSEVDHRALTRFLEQSLDHGFRLAIVEAASHAKREDILAAMTATIGPGLLRLAIDELPGADANLWQALQEPFTTHAPRCLALWGLESSHIWAHQLNVQRDLFVRDFAVPWLLFIHPASRVPLLQAAPDLCDFAILWLRDDSEPYAPVASTDMNTQDSSLSLSGPNVHNPLLQQARTALDAAEYDAARDALARFALQPDQDILDRIRHQLYGARLEREQGHPALAEALVRDARNMLAQQPPSAEAQALTRLADAELGIVLLQSGRYSEAETVLRRTLQLAEEALERDHPDYGAPLHSLAVVLVAQGRYLEAERIIRDALSAKEKTLRREHPEYARSLHTLAVILSKQGKHSEAEPILRATSDSIGSLLGHEHPDYSTSLHNLAFTLGRQGKYGEAEPILRDAVALRAKTLGREHPDYAAALNSLGNALVAQGKYGEAEPHLREALSLAEQAQGDRHARLYPTLVSLAMAAAHQGRAREGIRLLERALPIAQAAHGDEHPEVGQIRNLLKQLQRSRLRR